MQDDNPDVLYALVANHNGHLFGLYRLDRNEGDRQPNRAAGEQWRIVAGTPQALFGPNLQQPGRGV
ncbi:MAG: hypothetical protein R2867_25985 [Caldilineaceae bacterium]